MKYPIMEKIDSNFLYFGAMPSMNDFPSDYIWVAKWVEADSPSQAIIKFRDIISNALSRLQLKEKK